VELPLDIGGRGYLLRRLDLGGSLGLRVPEGSLLRKRKVSTME